MCQQLIAPGQYCYVIDDALADPQFWIAHDMAVLRRYLSDHHALVQAPPGIIDSRSWAYWHLMLDLQPGALPIRRLGDSNE